MTIEILNSDDMFIPYVEHRGIKYLLSVLWHRFDPYNKDESMERFKIEKVSVAIETKHGVILAEN